MWFPKLTPLQSRLAASLFASVILILIWLSLSPSSHSAYAAEMDSILNRDHNHRRLGGESGMMDDLGLDIGADMSGDIATGNTYEPEFAVGLEKSLVGRAQADQMELPNNQPKRLNIAAGEVTHYMMRNATVWGPPGNAGPGWPSQMVLQSDLGFSQGQSPQKLELRKRQEGETRPVYITINTCTQPTTNATSPSAGPPQLTLYVSQDPNNPKPGPNTADRTQQAIPLIEGYAAAKVDASQDVFVGVAAPSNMPDGFAGGWNYMVAASIDWPYHYYNNTQFLSTLDTDSSSALLMTEALYTGNDTAIRKKWMDGQLPLTMLVFPTNNTSVNGMRSSYCGLAQQNPLRLNVTAGMTDRGLSGAPKEQFHIVGMTPGTSYIGMLAMTGNGTTAGTGTIGGGGTIWRAVNFTTKQDANCQLLFNLPFCSQVAYAVPSNATSDLGSLKRFYDDSAANLYKNFSFSLQQIACNTTSTAQYSLARNCDDCARDYKNWLCAVSIPRCADISSPTDRESLKYLRPRNIMQPFANGTTLAQEILGVNASMQQQWQGRLYANSSRNPLVDEQIRPGPYKEVLPCRELCWELVKSCPASLQFACPEGKGVDRSYGWKGRGDMCNDLGIDFSAGLRVGAPSIVALGAIFGVVASAVVL